MGLPTPLKRGKGPLGGPKNCDLTNMMEYRHEVYQNHPNNTETHWNTSSHKICISGVGSKNHSCTSTCKYYIVMFHVGTESTR